MLLVQLQKEPTFKRNLTLEGKIEGRIEGLKVATEIVYEVQAGDTDLLLK